MTRAIERWSDDQCESEAWESLGGYTGDDIHRLMAKAAMTVLEAQLEIQDCLERNGSLAETKT